MPNGCTINDLSDLKDIHRRQDIWLIAAGKSLDYVDPAFFEDKITVGINHAYCRFITTHLVVRDHNFFADCQQSCAELGIELLAARNGFLGPSKQVPNVPNADGLWLYQFDTAWAGAEGLDLDVIGSDQMIAGLSTLHTALHVCAYMGARNIILCGADGGELDGAIYFDAYRDGSTPNVQRESFVSWLDRVERQTIQIRERLKAIYGCNVVSLNPFVNFGLEGHKYQHL